MALKLLSDAELESAIIIHTEAAHIIPFSLATFAEHEVLAFPSPFLLCVLTLSSVIQRLLLGKPYTTPSLVFVASPQTILTIIAMR